MAQDFFKGKGSKSLHKVTIDGKNYAYYANTVLYAKVGAVVGVTVAKDSDTLETSFNLASELRAGRVVKIKCSDVDGNKFTLLCTGEKLITALGTLRKQTINDKKIRTVYIPGRVGFR
jgi:hypothetical protein